MSDLDRLKTRLPTLFDRGLTLLRQRADAGDAAAQAQLEDVTGARSAVRLVVEGAGGGELWLAVADGRLVASDTAPEQLPVRLAVAVPADAMEVALGRLAEEGAEDDDRTALAVARAASKKAEAVIDGQRLDFHVIIEGTPDLGDVVSRVSVGAAEPPDQPGFTATVRYDDLEAAREGGVDAQQFLMGGRVRFAGDYVPALQLGMQLAQLQQRR